MGMTAFDVGTVVGRSQEDLTLSERFALAGKYAAFEIYTPKTLPLRRIEAVGDSAVECMKMLRARGLDPAIFEFVRLGRPY